LEGCSVIVVSTCKFNRKSGKRPLRHAKSVGEADEFEKVAIDGMGLIYTGLSMLQRFTYIRS
jgi:hypothetical protein